MKDFAVIGAGIVGLATAYQLQQKFPNHKILIIEKENDVAKHQTGNNSGVIHSGIYYKPSSLKAKNCIKGYNLLLDFCNENNIPYKLCGKVIVATCDEELPAMQNIYERGIANRLDGLRVLSSEELNEIEPSVIGVAALHVPQTGIIDYKVVAAKLKELLASKGCEFRFNEKVVKLIEDNDKVIVESGKNTYYAKKIISCAGLQSDRVAKLTNPSLPIRIIPFRGEYYKLKSERNFLVNSLVYPVPNPAFPFLGVHFTTLIDGGVEAGPNAVFAFKREGYSKMSFNFKDTYESIMWKGFQKVAKEYWRVGFGEFYRSFSKKAFVKALQKLIPSIEESDLEKGGAGVRAQACDYSGGLVDDFYIVEKQNIVHVCNAPSPAATSSFAIGEYLASRT